VAHVVQRDMMAMPLAPRGSTPFSSALDRLSSGHGAAVCGTGDSLVTADDPWLADNGIDIVDMELFAIAHVCQRHNIPWRAFKYLTDDFATKYRSSGVAEGQDLFWDAVKRLQKAQ
jgi:adenosylhomocysteine nucleosidase